MLVSQPNNVKVYNLSSGKSLPDWISDRKKRQLLKKDVELRRRIELIQDFDMPTASTGVKVSPDGQYIVTSGVYKPRIKCFDTTELSVKFDRCFDSECVKFEFLAEDFSKLVLLQADRYVEFHAQYGRYYRTRMPRFGRDMAYHKPSCDLYLVGDSSEVFRLNLEQGRYLQPYETDAGEINVCEINEQYQLLSVGTQNGKVVCFDPRSKLKVGVLDLIQPTSLTNNNHNLLSLPAVTSLAFNEGLEMAVGTQTGHILLYDLRSNKPRLTKNHYYELPIKSIHYHKHNHNILTSDSKIIKIWNTETGDNFTSIEPGIPINDTCIYKDSGLIFLANEATKNSVYYIPALGQAPRWCSFLDNITEELEESDEVQVYDDYKFVTSSELDDLGLGHLRGTNVLRAYMHGYFLDMRLYHKAKSIVEPFAYEEYRRKKIREKLEDDRASRIKLTNMPKVNRELAEKLIETKTKKKQGELSDKAMSNPLGDERFASMFTNRDFEVDFESEEYKLLHPVVSKHDKIRQKTSKGNQEDSGSDDDMDVWQEVRMASKQLKKRKEGESDETKNRSKQSAMNVKMFSLKDDFELANLKEKGVKNIPLGERLEKDTGRNIVRESGTSLGSREITFKLEKSKRDSNKEEALKAHKKERKKVRRSAGKLAPKGGRKKVFRRRGK